VKKKKNHQYKWKEVLSAYSLMAPSLILFLIIGLFTVLFSVYLSFFHLQQGSLLSSMKYAGFDNYTAFLFGESPVLYKSFWRAMKHNIIIAGSLILFVIPLALMFALLLQGIKRGVRVFRTVFLLPMVISSVAIFYVWVGIYEVDGSLNQILIALGLEQLTAPNGWLGEIDTALPALIIKMIWGGVPGMMILYFAGLQTVDPHLYEAAEIDGANYWTKLIHITWPILLPITVIAVILTLNGALQVFGEIWIMTKGGPAGQTMVVSVLIYQEAFGGGSMGVANAMAWFVGVLTFGLTLLSIRIFREK
jgi:ABC-type sugar transport system permease subunit